MTTVLLVLAYWLAAGITAATAWAFAATRLRRHRHTH